MADELNKEDPWKGVIARSGHFKDYYFQPGVITGVGDGTNQGLVRYTVALGQQSSGDDDDNGKWAYPFIMPNHAAYSTPVVGSKIWVMTNETNPDEVFYWLMPELNPLAQSMVDGGSNGDVWGCRQDGLGAIYVASSSEGGYTFSTPRGEISAGYGSNYSIDSVGVGSNSSKGSYYVGNLGNGSEAMVLGETLKSILTDLVKCIGDFAKDLPVNTVPDAILACTNFYAALEPIASALGIEDWLSDNSNVANNAAAKLAAAANSEAELAIDAMSNSETFDAAARMFNNLGYNGKSNWTAADIENMYGEAKVSPLKSALKEYTRTSNAAKYGVHMVGDNYGNISANREALRTSLGELANWVLPAENIRRNGKPMTSDYINAYRNTQFDNKFNQIYNQSRTQEVGRQFSSTPTGQAINASLTLPSYPYNQGIVDVETGRKLSFTEELGAYHRPDGRIRYTPDYVIQQRLDQQADEEDNRRKQAAAIQRDKQRRAQEEEERRKRESPQTVNDAIGSEADVERRRYESGHGNKFLIFG